MDKDLFDEKAKRLKTVNKVIKELDPAIRAPAWDVLAPYVTDKPAAGSSGGGGRGNSGGGGGAGSGDAASENERRTPKPLDEDALLDEFSSEHDPVANALLVTALLYGKYGNGPYAPKELSDFGEEHRLPMPQMGNFLRRTKRDEKKLFRNGKDGWMLTGDGAKWIGEHFGVKRGTEARSE
jgi:hypothetical protein